MRCLLKIGNFPFRMEQGPACSTPGGTAVAVVLGMDFGGTKIALAVCDLDGRCLAQQVLATSSGDGGDAVLERGIAAGRALLARIEEGYGLVAVGVSTIGIPRDTASSSRQRYPAGSTWHLLPP